MNEQNNYQNYPNYGMNQPPNFNVEQGYSAKIMRKSSNGNSLMLAIFIFFMLAGSVVALITARLLVGESSEYYNAILLVIQMVIQSFIGVPLAIFIYKLFPSAKGTEKIGSLFCKPQQSVWWVIRWISISIFFTYGTALATNLLSMLIQSLTGIELNQTDFSADDNLLSKCVNILCITILAPIFEEILIRGGLLGNTKRYGTWSAIIATGIFFGLLHMNYPQIPFACMMGICSAFMVVKTKSIFPSIITHLIVNTIGGIQSLFTGNIDLEKIQAYDMEYISENIVPFLVIMCAGFIIMGLLAIGLVLFILEIILHRDSFKIEKKYPEVSEFKKLLTYFTAPGTIILTIFLIVMTVVSAIPN